jgi:hypothetical protein
LHLPKIASAQVTRHVGTRGECRRGDRVFVCRDGPACPDRRSVRAMGTTGVRSRGLGVAGGRCRTVRTRRARSSCCWFQIRVRSNSSRRQICTQRSMIEFMRGIRTPLSTTSMSASLRTASNRAGNFPSRSRMRNRARQPASSRSMTRFFAACATHAAVGCAVAPRTRTRRLACSITASTDNRAAVKVTVSRKSQASRASACERRKSAHVLQARSGAGLSRLPSTSSTPWTRPT